MGNIMIAEQNINEEIKRYKALHYRFVRRLNRLSTSNVPEQMTCTMKNGRGYYSELWMEDGVKNTKYLGTIENAEVLAIKENQFLRKATSMLEKKINELEKCEKKLKPLTPEMINESLPKVYQLPPEKLKEVAGPDEEEKWYSASMKEKASIEARYGEWYPEGLRHKAKDGTGMRSKSEVSIANELINRGICYIYEMPYFIGPILSHPDFMFYSFSRCKPMIWEHAGMLGDEKYREDFSDRIDLYINHGYTPCVDVIFTFDSKVGLIDTRQINEIIDEYR